MNLDNFNFAQPLWLWGFLIIPIGFAWYLYCRNTANTRINGLEKFADKSLLSHLLLNTYKSKRKNMLALLYALLTTCIIIAMANPRWRYEEIEAYTPAASSVILLDMGEQMSARDVAPSRIIRARQNIEDLLNASRGLKIGLIGFAANPHLITPITDDIRTVKNFLPALDTHLISKQGDNLGAALQSATELLQGEPGAKKSIILISNGNFVDKDYSSQIEDLVANGVTIHVMGIGTVTGAPYTDQHGRMRKQHDQLVISKLNQAVLKLIAKKGNGVYIEANRSSHGIQTILIKAQHTKGPEHIVSGKIRQWEDSYYWFLIPAALIICILLSQRAFYVLVAVVSLNLFTSSDVQAFELGDLFKNADQQAQQQFAMTNFSEAAEQFKDHYRKGVALYRAGDYASAEQQFNLSDREAVKIPAQYNAGNSQMHQKKWRDAINSYEKVLQVDSEHEDAKFNLELAKKMLEKDDCDCDNKDKKKDGNQDKGGNDQQKLADNEPDQTSDNQNSDKKDSDKQDAPPKSDKKEDQQADKNDAAQQLDANPSAASPNKQQKAEQEARAQQWLNRIDSDIRVFLQNKFYIEDVLGKQ